MRLFVVMIKVIEDPTDAGWNQVWRRLCERTFSIPVEKATIFIRNCGTSPVFFRLPNFSNGDACLAIFPSSVGGIYEVVVEAVEAGSVGSGIGSEEEGIEVDAFERWAA